jgi:hypothetical protein
MTESERTASLAAQQLRWRCNPEELPFETRDDVAPMDDMVGQDRAIEALALALDLYAGGYNVYVAGPSGTGRSSAVYREIEKAVSVRRSSAA